MMSVRHCRCCCHISERLNFELSIKHRVLAAAVVQQHNRSTNGVVGNKKRRNDTETLN